MHYLWSLLAAGEISETQSDAAEDEGLRELGRWLFTITICLLNFVLIIVVFVIIIAITVDIVLALLDPELQVEELFEVAHESYALLSDAPQFDLRNSISAWDCSQKQEESLVTGVYDASNEDFVKQGLCTALA